MESLSILQKNKTLTNLDVNRILEAKHAKIKAGAYNDGKGLGLNKQPPLKGGHLAPYIECYKAPYEQMIVEVLQLYQPALALPAGKMESDRANTDKKKQSEAITKTGLEIDLLNKELGDHHPGRLVTRRRKAFMVSAVLFIADVAVNTKAFEAATGDNLLFALIVSACTSFIICMGAHFAGKQFQTAVTRTRKITIVALWTIFIFAFASVMASFRASLYDISGETNVNPNLFTILNMGYFFIAVCATYFFYPTNEEMKENREYLDKYAKIQTLKKEMAKMEKELGRYSQESHEKLQLHLQGVFQPEYMIERIKIMYMETVNEFKRANLLARNEICECFNDPIPTLNIAHIDLQSTINKYKNNENENNDNNNPTA